MKLQKLRSGFTLIELLVVITIIAILATWAVNVYTSQIQKARDSTRLTDLRALVGWVEQLYQDSGNYPNSWVAVVTYSAPAFADVKKYTPKLPKDPRTGQYSSDSNFEYTYSVWTDASWIAFQTYEFSLLFENEWNTTSRSATDWWNDQYRLEQWINIWTLRTSIKRTTALWTSWVDTATSPTYTCETVPTTVWGNSATWTCPTWTSSVNPAITLVIR